MAYSSRKQTMEDQPNNAALDVKLDYISKDITVIKSDIKEIKNDFIGRREFDQALSEHSNVLEDHELRIRANTDFISNLKGKYAILAVLAMLGIGIISSVISTTISKNINSNNCPQSFTCTQK